MNKKRSSSRSIPYCSGQLCHLSFVNLRVLVIVDLRHLSGYCVYGQTLEFNQLT
jgi:hypothetical protein